MYKAKFDCFLITALCSITEKEIFNNKVVRTFFS